MIKYIKGDLFSDYDSSLKTILVHGCNARGVMGSGVAKIFRNKYPEAYVKYAMDIRTKGSEAMLGQVSYFAHSDLLLLASAITQNYYGTDDKRYVSYDAVNSVFLNIFEIAIKDKYEQIVFPLIGAGLGGGDWLVIRSCIESAYTEAMLPTSIKLICFVSEEWMVESYGKRSI